ncbi:MAG TPA: translation initiation factor IF-3 [Patescibacteria group bacterium]|nr:translation initiation factor IF-3 [Patescibacteria group bacterium]
MKKTNLYFKSNEQIHAAELRVLTVDNKQIGVISRDEALKKAREENLDLILIAESANPPVAKIADLGKFIYQEEKKLKKSKAKVSDLKEIRFSPFIGEADYTTRVKRVKEFLEDRDKVKLTVVFLGRQMNSKSFGYGLLDKIVKELGDTIHIDSEPKFLGRYLSMIISPTGKKSKEFVDNINRKESHAETENKEISNKEI